MQSFSLIFFFYLDLHAYVRRVSNQTPLLKVELTEFDQNDPFSHFLFRKWRERRIQNFNN